jgi:amidase
MVDRTTQVAAQAGYPVITLPAYVHSLSGMPFGLALMNTVFSEAMLIKYVSAIENLQVTSGIKY